MSSFAERRRLAVALIVTLVAVPALMLSGGHDSGNDDAAPAVPTSGSDDTQPLDPAFLPTLGSTTTLGPITVNVPPALTGTHIKGTNLDNGRSLTCTNATTESRGDLVIIIDADVFIGIADLVDAPIPVEISF